MRLPWLCQPNQLINRNRPQNLLCSTQTRIRGTQRRYLEDANVVADALLLVLSYALGNPSDVPDFLIALVWFQKGHVEGVKLACSRSLTQP